MGFLKDTLKSGLNWGYDNLIPSFRKGGRTAKPRVLKVVVVGSAKPRRRVQKAKRRK